MTPQFIMVSEGLNKVVVATKDIRMVFCIDHGTKISMPDTAYVICSESVEEVFEMLDDTQ